MSYGSAICPRCHGEVRVFIDTDGIFGTCPTCGRTIDRKSAAVPSRIPDEGAFYEVITIEVREKVVSMTANGSAIIHQTCGEPQSLAIYTDREKARARAREVTLASLESIGDGRNRTEAYVKKWNHARTDSEPMVFEYCPEVDA